MNGKALNVDLWSLVQDDFPDEDELVSQDQVPHRPGPRTCAGTAEQQALFSRQLQPGVPEWAELHALRQYLQTHCWPGGTSTGQCIRTTMTLQLLYGGTFRGGWPRFLKAAPDGHESGYWCLGHWHHHCWLELRRPGRTSLLIDLTADQFNGPFHDRPGVLVTAVRDAPAYRPSRDLAGLAGALQHAENVKTAQRWQVGWLAHRGRTDQVTVLNTPDRRDPQGPAPHASGLDCVPRLHPRPARHAPCSEGAP